MQSKNKKTLREKYLADPKASEFFKKHPELFNAQCEPSVEYDGYGNYGSYSLSELEENKRVSRSLKVAEALPHYPECRLKSVLESYLEGTSISAIQKKFFNPNIKRKSVLEYISKGKKKVLKWFSNYQGRYLNPKTSIKLTEKRLKYENETRVITLYFDSYIDDYVWCGDNGRVLTEEIQDILDSETDYSQWDDVILLGNKDPAP